MEVCGFTLLSYRLTVEQKEVEEEKEEEEEEEEEEEKEWRLEYV